MNAQPPLGGIGRGALRSDPEFLGVDDELLAVVTAGEGAEPQRLRQAGVGTANAQLTVGRNAKVSGFRAGNIEAAHSPRGLNQGRKLRNIKDIEAWHVTLSSLRRAHSLLHKLGLALPHRLDRIEPPRRFQLDGSPNGEGGFGCIQSVELAQRQGDLDRIEVRVAEVDGFDGLVTNLVADVYAE